MGLEAWKNYLFPIQLVSKGVMVIWKETKTQVPGGWSWHRRKRKKIMTRAKARTDPMSLKMNEQKAESG